MEESVLERGAGRVGFAFGICSLLFACGPHNESSPVSPPLGGDHRITATVDPAPPSDEVASSPQKGAEPREADVPNNSATRIGDIGRTFASCLRTEWTAPVEQFRTRSVSGARDCVANRDKALEQTLWQLVSVERCASATTGDVAETCASLVSYLEVASRSQGRGPCVGDTPTALEPYCIAIEKLDAKNVNWIDTKVDFTSNKQHREQILQTIAQVRSRLAAPFLPQIASMQQRIGGRATVSCKRWETCKNWVGNEVSCNGAAAITKAQYELATYVVEISNGTSLDLACDFDGSIPNPVPQGKRVSFRVEAEGCRSRDRISCTIPTEKLASLLGTEVSSALYLHRLGPGGVMHTGARIVMSFAASSTSLAPGSIGIEAFDPH